jgi:hypothetical protein
MFCRLSAVTSWGLPLARYFENARRRQQNQGDGRLCEYCGFLQTKGPCCALCEVLVESLTAQN